LAFVGRTRELDLLEREAALVAELGAGRVVLIEGPPGAGKSTLVTAFLTSIAAARPDLAIARGRCLQTFGSADPYLPFVDALRDLTDERTAGSIGRETLSGLITELAPYWLQVVPLVGNLLSAGFATAAKLRGQSLGDGTPSKEALFIQYLDVIRGVAAQHPLLLFLDDLHWSDHASVALLGHLARGIGQLPVLVVGTLRLTDAELEQHPVLNLARELEREDLLRRIRLDELDAGSLDELVQAEFGGPVAGPLLRWIRLTAGGNPLFATELVRLVKENGAAQQIRDEWHLTEAARQMEVPRSAEAVIETRIERLSEDELRLLQYASIDGNEFDATLLSRLLEQDELDVLDTLERVERRDRLVQAIGETELPDGDTAMRFRFSHALVQTVLYRQVVGKRRVLLHRKAAEVLEQVHGAAAEGVAGRLARHFNEGRVPAQAHRYALSAAAHARRVFAQWEAEELLTIALANAPDDAERCTVQEALGDVYDVVGFYERAVAALEAALSLTAGAGADPLRLKRKTLSVQRKAALLPAPQLLGKVRALLAEPDAVAVERCHLLLELGRAPGATGVTPALAEAVEIAERVAVPALLAETLEQYAVHLIFSGAPEQSLPHLERATSLVGSGQDPLRLARFNAIAGVAHARMNRYRDALAAFEKMLELYERIGDPNGIGAACNNAGALLLRLGRWQEAEEVIGRAAQLHERRDRANLIQSLFNLAELALRRGELDLAEQRYQALLERALAFEHWMSEAVAHAGLGHVQLERGQTAGAQEAGVRVAAVIGDREQWFEDREVVELLFARLEAAEGRVDEAVARLGQASAALESFDRYPWARVEIERARMLRAVDPGEARVILSHVIASMEGSGSAVTAEAEALAAELPVDATRKAMAESA
jgi:tetratricopeptide (TPR) repeat protein